MNNLIFIAFYCLLICLFQIHIFDGTKVLLFIKYLEYLKDYQAAVLSNQRFQITKEEPTVPQTKPCTSPITDCMAYCYAVINTAILTIYKHSGVSMVQSKVQAPPGLRKVHQHV